MAPPQRYFAPIVWLGALALLGVSILFAPVINGGWCADAVEGGISVCGSFQRSVAGIDTNVWLWLAASAVVVVVTVAAARRRRPSGR